MTLFIVNQNPTGSEDYTWHASYVNDDGGISYSGHGGDNAPYRIFTDEDAAQARANELNQEFGELSNWIAEPITSEQAARLNPDFAI